MSAEPTSSDLAIYGTYVIAAIITTAFALWLEYRNTYLEKLAKEEPEYDRNIELQAIKGAGLLAFILQAMLFIAGEPTRDKHPILSFLVFIATILIQGQLQNSAENKIRPVDAPKQNNNVIKSLAVMLATVAGYFIIVYATSLSMFGLAAALNAPGWAQGAAGLAGAVLGIFIGLGFSFAFGPITMRNALPVKALEDEKIRNLFDNCFAQAKLNPPAYWVIDVENFRANNAMIAGFSGGKGWLRPALFITNPILKNCTQEELQAIVLHEVSHLAMNHMRKRLWFSFAIVVSTIITIGFIALVAQLLLPPAAVQLTTMISAVLAFAVPFAGIRKHGQNQEIEADTVAILRFGATLDAMAGALRKIDQMNSQLADENTENAPLRADSGTPQTEQRIIQLRALVEFSIALENAKMRVEKVDEEKLAA